MSERFFWLGFAMCSGIGPAKFKTLLNSFQTAERAWKANEDALVMSLGKAAAALIIDHRKTFSPEAYCEKLQKHNVDYLTLDDKDYPAKLAEIQKPPYVLFIKGNKNLLKSVENNKGLAVVGTRKITDYGRQVTQTLTEELVTGGYVIISGLALGVDAVAHKAAIDACGKTIAVLGCGIDCCNPRENSRLYAEILKQDGLIVSEYGLGVQPNKGSFPSRNRIIAGLSTGVLVTEGAEDSGSLITANDAFENNRPVFAVPGPITSSVSRGPIALINNGAKIVTAARDIFQEIGGGNGMIQGNGPAAVKGDTKEEQSIIDLLAGQSMHFDELVKQTGLPSSYMGTLLSLMEMKGMVQSLSSGFFMLS